MIFSINVTPQTSELLQKLAFKNGWNWGKEIGAEVRFTSSTGLEFHEDIKGIFHGESSHQKLNLDEAIKRLSPKPKRKLKPKNFSVNVTPATSELIQKICFNKGIMWSGQGKTVPYLGVTILQVHFNEKRLFYTANNAPPRVTLTKALKYLESYNGT